MQKLYNMKDSKSLSKSSSKLLMALAEDDRNVFTFADAQTILATSDAATRKLLSDLMAKKWLISLTRGKYIVVPLSAGAEAAVSESWYVIAKYLSEPRPYFLSHYTAMAIHNMTTQPVSTVFISMPHKKRAIAALGASFRFVYIDSSKMWGARETWATPTEQVKVSDLERTIVDCLNNPRLSGGVSEIAKGIHARGSDVDYQKLVKDVGRFGNNAVAKRLGFLLELYDLDNAAVEKLRQTANASYALLDPSLPPRGNRWSRWRLRLNLNPEELREIVKT